jgi:UDP:flavonoid glycosyltransferase YjiC (YdhE family)
VGVRLKYGRVNSDEIVEALLAVLETTSYSQAALRIQASFRAAGGASAAADRLELLATNRMEEAAQVNRGLHLN